MTPRLIGHSVADSDGVILSIDEAVAGFLHHSQRDIVGQSYKFITCPDDLEDNARSLQVLDRPETSVTLSKRYVRADGVFLPAEVQVSRLSSPKLGGLMVGTIYTTDLDPLGHTPAALWREARAQRDGAIRRAAEFGSNLFDDVGWLVLLEYYIAECEGRPVEMSLAYRGDAASFARWGRALCDLGLLECRAGDFGHLQQTSAGIAKIETVLAASLARS